VSGIKNTEKIVRIFITKLKSLMEQVYEASREELPAGCTILLSYKAGF